VKKCAAAPHITSQNVRLYKGWKFFWRRGIETRKSSLHAWENFKYPIHCNHQRSPAGVSQSRKERCAGRLTSGKAVDWDGRAGPGARAAGGSAAGAELGAPQRVQEVPRAQQQVLERGARHAREHHGTPPPLVLWQLPPLVLGLLRLLLLPLLLLVLVLLLLGLLLQAARRHAVCDSLQETCTTSTTRTTSTTSTTSTTRTNSTYISQPAWESPSVGEGSLPSSPSLLSFLSCPEPLSQYHYIFSGQPRH